MPSIVKIFYNLIEKELHIFLYKHYFHKDSKKIFMNKSVFYDNLNSIELFKKYKKSIQYKIAYNIANENSQ
ncbi:hypothetical protein RhiirB3_437635 [Rhizophagus irregularis]|nr:hypothetical protein RhiirB3_437635 [Rhizophagus irregularis]